MVLSASVVIVVVVVAAATDSCCFSGVGGDGVRDCYSWCCIDSGFLLMLLLLFLLLW